MQRLGGALQLELAEIPELKEALDQVSCVLRDGRRVGRCCLLHALREPHSVSLGSVVHAQVVADLAHDDVAGVQADAGPQAHAVLRTDFLCKTPELVIAGSAARRSTPAVRDPRARSERRTAP